MPHTEPTHTITHRRSGTTAHVPLGERVGALLEAELPLAAGDKNYVAMAFKNTPPRTGPDLSDEYVNFGALEIQPIRRGPEYGEEPVLMGPGGVVLSDGCDECPSCEQGYHDRCKQNCPIASRW